MKKNSMFKVLVCLMALLAGFAFTAYSDDDDSGSSGSSSSTTILSGKVYASQDSSESLSFAASGNSVVITEEGIAGYGTYSISGTTVTIIANGETSVLVYNSASDSLYSSEMGITLYRL